MWFWAVIAILVLAVGGLAVARSGGHRLRGGFMLAAAAALAIVIEVLIRVDAITVSQGTELMTWAVLLLIAAGVALVPGRGGRAGRA